MLPFLINSTFANSSRLTMEITIMYIVYLISYGKGTVDSNLVSLSNSAFFIGTHWNHTEQLNLGRVKWPKGLKQQQKLTEKAVVVSNRTISSQYQAPFAQLKQGQTNIYPWT